MREGKVERKGGEGEGREGRSLTYQKNRSHVLRRQHPGYLSFRWFLLYCIWVVYFILCSLFLFCSNFLAFPYSPNCNLFDFIARIGLLSRPLFLEAWHVIVHGIKLQPTNWLLVGAHTVSPMLQWPWYLSYNFPCNVYNAKSVLVELYMFMPTCASGVVTPFRGFFPSTLLPVTKCHTLLTLFPLILMSHHRYSSSLQPKCDLAEAKPSNWYRKWLAFSVTVTFRVAA